MKGSVDECNTRQEESTAMGNKISRRASIEASKYKEAKFGEYTYLIVHLKVILEF